MPEAKFTHSNHRAASENLQTHIALSYAFLLLLQGSGGKKTTAGKRKHLTAGSSSLLLQPFCKLSSSHCELYRFLVLMLLCCSRRRRKMLWSGTDLYRGKQMLHAGAHTHTHTVTTPGPGNRAAAVTCIERHLSTSLSQVQAYIQTR